MVYDLFRQLDALKVYDEELWSACFKTLGQKKRINNMHYFAFYHQTMLKMNEMAEEPFFKKLDKDIAQLKEKHFNINREWRYDFNSARFKSWEELVARRDDVKLEDFKMSRGGVD